MLFCLAFLVSPLVLGRWQVGPRECVGHAFALTSLRASCKSMRSVDGASPATASAAPVEDGATRLAQFAKCKDVKAFLQVLHELLGGGGFPDARKQLMAAAARKDCPEFGSFALQCLVACCNQPVAQQSERRTGPAESVLADLGPSACEESLTILPPVAEAAICKLAVGGCRELLLAARVLRAWKVPESRSLDGATQSTLAEKILQQARAGAGAAAGTALVVLPGLLKESEAAEVMEAADDERREDVADKLAKALGPELQAYLIRRRQRLGRLKSAAKAVRAFGLEAEFPDADFNYKVKAVSWAAKAGKVNAVLGMCMGEPRLHETCVKNLLHTGQAFLAVEMADAWNVVISSEARNAGLEAKAMVESTHLRLPVSVEVVFVDDEALLPHMRSTLLKSFAVGLDAEWDPSRGSPASLLQVATDEVVFLIDLLALGMSEALGRALADVMGSQGVVKVAFEGHRDLAKIAAQWPCLSGCRTTTNLIDLQEVAALLRASEEGLSKKQAAQGLSLASLAQQYFSMPLDKTMQMSNWARRPLSVAQLHYAALDAWVPLQVHKMLDKLLKAGSA